MSAYMESDLIVSLENLNVVDYTIIELYKVDDLYSIQV